MRVRCGAICDTLDTSGGIFWNDERFLCASCWGEVVKSYGRARAEAERESKLPIDNDHPF